MGYKSRKIWSEFHNKEIPKDENGFTYEIHHIDGNNKNDNITNLLLVSIQEHFNIHLQQKDWGAVALIGKRIGLGPSYMSDIQRGKKRPGIGGRKKGTPGNKGFKHSEKTKILWSKKRKGKIHSTKFLPETIIKIKELYKNRQLSEENINKKTKNGKILTFERAFSKYYAKEFNMSAAHIYNLITKDGIRKDVKNKQ